MTASAALYRRMLGIPGGRRRLLRRVAAAMLLLAAFFTWRLADSLYRELGHYAGTAVLHTSVPFTAGGLEEMEDTESRAEKPVGFSLWAQLDRQYLDTPLTGRTATSSVLLVAGDSRLALPVPAVLSREDFTGCIIDRQTALDLFGHENATGAVVRWREEEYVVRSVFAGPSRTMAIRASQSNETPMTHISVADGEEAQPFALRHGCGGGLVVKNSTYRSMTGFFRGLPLVACALLLLEAVWCRLLWNRAYPVRGGLLLLLLSALVTSAIIWLMASLPPALTPDRWSDLKFWSLAFQSFGDTAIELFAAQKFRCDLLILGLAARSAAWSLAALLLVPPGVGLLRKK